MIVVPPKTLDFECSAPVEDLPVWGVTVGYTEIAPPPASPPVERILWENAETGDLWCAQGYNLYKRVSGVWGLFYTFDRKIKAMTGDYTRGRIYVSLYVASPSNSEICGIDHIMPAATPDSHYDTASYVRSMAVDRTTGRIYLGSVDKVEYASAIPYSGGLHTDAYGNIAGIAINSATGKLYVLRTDEILVQTNFTGAYASTAFDYDAQSISVSETTGDVYVLDAGTTADIYKQTAGSGAFTLVDEGVHVGDGMSVTASEVYDGVYVTEQDTTAPLKLYGPTVIFQRDEYAILNDRVYISLVDDNAAEPGTDTAKWFDYGPTNPGKAFDDQLITLTVGLVDDLYLSFIDPGIDTLGLFNVAGTNAVLRVFDGTGLVSTTTQAITSRNVAFNDVADGLIYEVNITGPTPSIGGVVAGLAEDIGQTLWGVNFELVSYSKVVLDDFGRATFTRRGRAKRATFPLWAQMADVDSIYEVFNANDAKLCMWQGDETTKYLLLYGHYKRFDMPLNQLSGVKYNVEVLGDVDTSDEADTLTYARPAFVATRAALLPDGWTVAVWFSNTAELGPASGAGFSLPDLSTLTYIAGSEGNVFLFETELYISPLETPQLSYTEGASAGVVSIYGVDLPNVTLTVNNESEYPAEPAIVSATIDETGATLTLVFNAAMTQGAGYLDVDFNLDSSVEGNDIGVTYVSGDTTNTHTYAIGAVIRSGAVVNLDYNGRAEGIEDVYGRDLAAVASRAVTNDSAEDYGDIVLWSGFEGTITGTTYEATNYDYPAFHSGVVEDSYIMITPSYKVVGNKCLYFSGSAMNAYFGFDPISTVRGRIGLWWRPVALLTNRPIVTLTGAVESYAWCLGVQVGLTADVITVKGRCAGGEWDVAGYSITLPYELVLLTAYFVELAWDYETGAFKIFINGTLMGTITKISSLVGTFAYVLPGRSFLMINPPIMAADNLIISTDPNRDLYALALLEAYPGA